MLQHSENGDSEYGHDHPAQSGQPRRSRDQVLRQIKLELLTDAELGILGSDERSRGSDPYNSRLGAAPRDVWSRRPRA